eukprot:2701321-Rhodomonas_salina.1
MIQALVGIRARELFVRASPGWGKLHLKCHGPHSPRSKTRGSVPDGDCKQASCCCVPSSPQSVIHHPGSLRLARAMIARAGAQAWFLSSASQSLH